MLADIGALLPPIGVGLIFWFVIRSIMRADRAERASLAAAERAAREYPQGPKGDTDGPDR